jgi:hypothetical protein
MLVQGVRESDNGIPETVLVSRGMCVTQSVAIIYVRTLVVIGQGFIKDVNIQNPPTNSMPPRRRESSANPNRTRTGLIGSLARCFCAALLVCVLIIFILIVFADSITASLNHRYAASRDSFQLSKMVDIYNRLGFECHPHHCDNEQVIRNVTTLSASELDVVVALGNPIMDLESTSKILLRNHVTLFIIVELTEDGIYICRECIIECYNRRGYVV